MGWSEEDVRKLTKNGIPILPDVKRVAKVKEVDAESPLERAFVTYFEQYCRSIKISTPTYVREYNFDKDTDYRMDFAWLQSKVFTECEGSIHQSDRRTWIKDIVKYNLAASQGWLLLRCTTAMLNKDPFAFMAQLVKTIQERSKGEQNGK